MKKKIMAMALALILTLGLAGFAAAETALPEYLNLDGYVPMVKEGTDIVLRVAAFDQWLTSSDRIDDTWAWQYFTKYLGLKFEIEHLDATNVAERKNLMFASGDLPDMMIAMGFSTGEMVNYGMINKQLMDMGAYISETLTPGLIRSFGEYPTAKAACTAPDGAIYTLPFLYGMGDEDPSTLDNMAEYRTFVRQTWLDKLGIENPATVDGFLDMLRQFKAKDPAGIGSDHVIPIGANADFATMMILPPFLNAYGIIASGSAYAPALTADGKVVIPAMEDGYKAYLTFLKTCYTEGLISPDFFTMSEEQMRALNAEGKTGVLTDWAHYISVPETYEEWAAMNPLTISEGDSSAMKKGAAFAIGGFVMSAGTNYPELCMRFADYLFTPEGFYRAYSGPLETETELRMGLVKGMRVMEYEDGEQYLEPVEVIDGDNTSGYEYTTTRIYPFNQHVGNIRGCKDFSANLAGIEVLPFRWKLENNPDLHYRYLISNATHDICVEGYPGYVYLTEEETQVVTDVTSMVKDYIKAESAKFIIGTRPLEDYDAFRQELIGMGIQDYLDIYAKAYEAYGK